jgi:hypothetical protein
MQEPSLSKRDRAVWDLILAVLLQAPGQIVRSDEGLTTRTILALTGLTNTKSVSHKMSGILNIMDTYGFIVREVRVKRTYSVALLEKFTPEQTSSLVAAMAANRQVLSMEATSSVATVSDGASLLKDCISALHMFQRVAQEATQRNNRGDVVISGNGVMHALRLRGEAARTVRKVLRELGLAKAIKQVEGTEFDWWWRVSDAETINPEAFSRVARRLAAQGETYARALEDRNTERRFAGSTPANLPDNLCSPVIISRAAGVTQAPVGADPRQLLVEIIKTLEERLEEALARVATMQEEHDQEVQRLQEEIVHLRQNLAPDSTIQALLDKYSPRS